MKNNEWNSYTSIKDPIHGYISIPKPIAKEIVDSKLFQRLKGVSQTGMTALYPNATHTRFCHSLGVYHLGRIGFQCFRENIEHEYKYIFNMIGETEKSVEFKWSIWELIFGIACLLHDCGHAPYSHSLEFVYDFPYSADQNENSPLECRSPNKDLISFFGKDSCFDFDFFNRSILIEEQYKNDRVVGAPHERMSAFLIISGRDDPAHGYRETIGNLISSFVASYHETLYTDWKEKYFQIDKMGQCEFFQDLEFMVRMIIGCQYSEKTILTFANALPGEVLQEQCRVEYQLRNCIIQLLNSKLDVDSLDYTVRDAGASGYKSTNVDIERLLKSKTITVAYDFENLILCESDFCYHVQLREFSGLPLAPSSEQFSEDNDFNATISGSCTIKNENSDVHLRGNVTLQSRAPTTETSLNIAHTTDDFSASVILPKCTESFKILPRTTTAKKSSVANLYIHGKVCGAFSGKIFGCDERIISWKKSFGATPYISPAYKMDWLH